MMNCQNLPSKDLVTSDHSNMAARTSSPPINIPAPLKVSLLSAFVALFFVGGVAEACSCVQGDLPYRYNIDSDVMRVKVLKTLKWGGTSPDFLDDLYLSLAVVIKVYKGCTQPSDFVILKSSQSLAECGIKLKDRRQWLVTVNPDDGPGTFLVDSCGYNRNIKDVPRKDRQFLNKRSWCCERKCYCANGEPPFNCLVDPCRVSKCGEKGAKCTSNYCGGCNAEWADPNGQPVCNKCKRDEDCGFRQACTSEGCQTACQEDTDCGPGYACGQEGACEEQKEQNLMYYKTCGDHVCRLDGWREKKGVPLCEEGVNIGEKCVKEGYQCDPKDACNSLVECARSDPTQSGICPISRRSTKRDIDYLDSSARDKIASDLLSFQLATWNYKQEAAGTEPRLGFIIDDVEPSPSVDGTRDMVDMYGYLSMTVAALQKQQEHIEELQAQVDRFSRQFPVPVRPNCSATSLVE